MPIASRRTVLRAVGGSALVGALGTGLADAASAAPDLTPADLETLRRRWVDGLTSASTIRETPSTFVGPLASMDRKVDALLDTVSPTSTRYFSNLDWSVGATDIARSNAMRLNFVNLQAMAVAWATPGSAHEGSAEVLTSVRRGLAHLHATVYNTDTTWFGNWWSWIIGATRPLADTMAILHAELDQAEIDAYCAAMDHFLPNRDPRLQIHPAGVQESVGANRVDICRAFIVRSVVQPDTVLLGEAVAALSPTWQYVTEGNGFFADGSFVQHSTIGYTGTYGLVLLDGLSRLFALLAGTAFDITDPTRDNLTDAIERSFAPLMYNGQMMDAVRGRAVSRYAERSIDDGNLLIECTLRLARAADDATATRWRGLCRQWIESNDAETISDSTNIGRLALVAELLAADVTPVPDRTGPRMFPAMDRLVYRGEDNSWAMCVAMCSRRIAWSEGTGAENFHGALTSQGMTYLYLGDDDDHFDDEFWATSDLAAPPGTTVDLTPLPPNPEGQWGERTPDNEWTGGVVFEDLALTSMHLVAPGGTGLVARKTWFALPDMVVALGSDLSTRSDQEVRTVVEHRNLGTEPRPLVVDGTEVTAPTTRTGARWAHVDGVGGYLFLEPTGPLLAGVAEREGTWRRNNTNSAPGTDVVRRRQYATLALSHGSGQAVAGSGYAYALLPGADRAATSARREHPGVVVVRNDATAQALRHGTYVLAASFWAPGSVDELTSDGPACVVVRSTPGMARLSVSDPTQARDLVTLTLADTPVTRVKGRDAGRVTLRRDGTGVVIVVDTSGTAGRTLEVSLHQ